MKCFYAVTLPVQSGGTSDVSFILVLLKQLNNANLTVV